MAKTPTQDGITISRSIQWFMFSPSRSGQKPAQVQLEPSEQTGTIPFAGIAHQLRRSGDGFSDEYNGQA